MIKEMTQGRVCMLVNTASEGESDESVVSAESEKREKRGEKCSMVVVCCLTGIGYPPQLRALHEKITKKSRKILEKSTKILRTFYIEFISNFI